MAREECTIGNRSDNVPVSGATTLTRNGVTLSNVLVSASGAMTADVAAACGADMQCREVKRINVSAAFFLSIEFRETGYLAYRTHLAAFGRPTGTPVPLRFADFLTDTQSIGKGVGGGAAGWEQQLEANEQSYFNSFASRARFTTDHPTTLMPAQFVDALFANAGVTPSAAERQAALGEFGAAADTSDVAARARALRRVAENASLAQQEFRRAFVLMEYFGYLRRDPDAAPDSGFEGYNFWLGKLNPFDGNFVEAEMVKAFLESMEYRQGFGQ